jgi:hypothetical protein
MRVASFVLLLLLAAPALAQDPVPDTTSAWLYYPLAVGNVWEYEDAFGVTEARYRRVSIERDTLIGGQRYFVQRTTDYAIDFVELASYEQPIRFDTTAANVVFRDGDPYFPCRLDTPFPEDGGSIECDFGFVVGIGPEVTVHIGTSTVVTAVKAFDGLVSGPDLAAGIGVIRLPCELCAFEPDLVYARVNGIEYGAPSGVAVEPDAPATGLALSVYPNPTRGVATLSLTVPVPQTVTVEVFDVLGRRVYREAHAATGAASLLLDGARWTPGVYVVRVTVEGGTRATARLVRR